MFSIRYGATGLANSFIRRLVTFSLFLMLGFAWLVSCTAHAAAADAIGNLGDQAHRLNLSHSLHLNSQTLRAQSSFGAEKSGGDSAVRRTARSNGPYTAPSVDEITPYDRSQEWLSADTTQAPPAPPWTVGQWLMFGLQIVAFLIALCLLVYTFRHILFTLNRLFGKQRHPYADIDTADWPHVTIFVAAHNEEAVIAGSLQALLGADYPVDRLEIVPVNDRSVDRTREIIDGFVAQYPGRIRPFHRIDGKPGKAAALKDATATVTGGIIVVFDADYLPSKGLVKQLVSAFFDPEVGAVMGRVVPLNVGSNLLTRLLDLERAGGYQVDQQARMNLNLVPQYGGTVGGVRVRALDSIGGWHDDVLAEDTDLTYRLLLRGWKTVYQNRCECYEEVPESWSVRYRQIMRWGKGHNQAMYRHSKRLLQDGSLPVLERFDGLLLLAVYFMSPVVILGWVIGVLAFYFGNTPLASAMLLIVIFTSYCTLGNFAAFFEISAAVHLDGNRRRIRLLPFNLLGFIVSLVGISQATISQIFTDRLFKRGFQWDKTVRYRKGT